MANQGFNGLDRTIIGDIGCLGVDVQKWLKDNQIQLFPGQVNRWLLCRTLRDSPSTADVERTLLESFARWFGAEDDVSFDINLTAQTSEGGRTKNVDGLRVLNAARSTTRPAFARSIARRENCTILPTIDGTYGYLWLEVVFNYRGTVDKMPWPVDVLHTTGLGPLSADLQGLRYCPIKTDWMLVEVAEAAGKSPAAQSTASVLTEVILKPASDVASTAVSTLLQPALLPIWVGLGIWAYSKVRGK